MLLTRTFKHHPQIQIFAAYGNLQTIWIESIKKPAPLSTKGQRKPALSLSKHTIHSRFSNSDKSGRKTAIVLSKGALVIPAGSWLEVISLQRLLHSCATPTVTSRRYFPVGEEFTPLPQTRKACVLVAASLYGSPYHSRDKSFRVWLAI